MFFRLLQIYKKCKRNGVEIDTRMSITLSVESLVRGQDLVGPRESLILNFINFFRFNNIQFKHFSAPRHLENFRSPLSKKLHKTIEIEDVHLN